MKALLLLFVSLVFVACAVAGFGYYRGWFDVTVDKEKIQQDKETVTGKAKDAWHKVKGKVGASTDNIKEEDSRP